MFIFNNVFTNRRLRGADSIGGIKDDVRVDLSTGFFLCLETVNTTSLKIDINEAKIKVVN